MFKAPSKPPPPLVFCFSGVPKLALMTVVAPPVPSNGTKDFVRPKLPSILATSLIPKIDANELASAITPALADELGSLLRNPIVDAIITDAPSLYIASIASPNLATGITSSGPASPISAGVADLTYPPVAYP